MIQSILVLCIFSVACAASLPGKAVFWTHHNGQLVSDSSTSHVTKSVTAAHVNDFVAKNAEGYEVLAVLKPKSGSVLDHAAINDAFRSSKAKAAFMNVYQDKSRPTLNALESSVLTKNSQKLTMKEFQEKCNHENGLMSNRQMDVVELTVSSEEDIKTAANLSGKVLLAVFDEPSLESVAPESRGEFSRLLSSDVQDGIYYKPEGAEYSIYYADTYLYITPDILTGIITGIFFFFTILIGVTCLGSIQGMSMFYDKLPTVGKEA